jgi:hypothetical protein
MLSSAPLDPCSRFDQFRSCSCYLVPSLPVHRHCDQYTPDLVIRRSVEQLVSRPFSQIVIRTETLSLLACLKYGGQTDLSITEESIFQLANVLLSCRCKFWKRRSLRWYCH